jgi:formylglycine-generating enzyme required for sulfatase activity
MRRGLLVTWLTALVLDSLLAQEPVGKRYALLKEITNSIGMRLVLIPAGKFLLGSSESDHDANQDEKPQHKVEITKAFYLGKYEVTRGQFRKFVADNGYKTTSEKTGGRATWRDPGINQTDEHPVVWVTWPDAKAFCDWLSQKEGKNYRLPTEAEWEYSCRAGTTTRFQSGDNADSLKRVARFGLNYDQGTAPVGQLEPNAFGLYDMNGNVWEWCADWYDLNYYRSSPAQDPHGPSAGSLRVFRGSTCFGKPRDCRAASRFRGVPASRIDVLGFRVVLVR